MSSHYARIDIREEDGTSNILHDEELFDDMTDVEEISSLSDYDDKALHRDKSFSSTDSDPIDRDEDDDDSDYLNENSPLKDKIIMLLKNAYPLVISFFLSVVGTLILMIYAGHVKEPEEKGEVDLSVATVFAGVALATLYCNVTFRSLIIGMTGAVETLASQNNGAKNYKEVGYTLQRSIFVLGCTSSISIFAWLNGEKFFLWVGIEPNVCIIIKNVLLIRLYEIPFSCVNESYEKYLMAIGVMHSPMYANMTLICSVTIWGAIFMYGLKYDYKYLAVTWVFSVITAGIAMYLTSKNNKSVVRTLQKWNWIEVLNYKKLKLFIELGIPGTLMLCSEWWAYEMLTIFAGKLGTNEVSAENIIMQLAGLAFMIPLGLSVATASIVGNALGANKRNYSIQMSYYSLLTILILELLIGIIMRMSGFWFCRVFTDDEGVIQTTYELIDFLSIFCIIDGIQGVASGILRGAGRQAVGAITNIIAFYIIGLPSAYYLCFHQKMRVPGLMIGISVGTSFQVFCLVYMIHYKQDYLFQLATIKKDGNDCDIDINTVVVDDGDGVQLNHRNIQDMDSSSAPLTLKLNEQQYNQFIHGNDNDNDNDNDDDGDGDGDGDGDDDGDGENNNNRIKITTTTTKVNVNVNVNVDDEDADADDDFTLDDIDTALGLDDETIVV